MNRICEECGGSCCKSFDSVGLHDDEIERLSELGADIYLDQDEYVMDIKGGCQFQKDGKCSIYKQRPRACKEWKCQKLENRVTCIGELTGLQNRALTGLGVQIPLTLKN